MQLSCLLLNGIITGDYEGVFNSFQEIIVCVYALTDFPKISGNFNDWLFLSTSKYRTAHGMGHRSGGISSVQYYLPISIQTHIYPTHKKTSAKASKNSAWQQVKFLEILKLPEFFL